MKRVISIFLLVSAFVVFPLIPEVFCGELLDRIVAVVNDDAITQSELDRQLAPIYQAYKKQYKGAEFFTQMGKARSQILNQMIEDRLVLQDAKSKEIKVSEEEVNNKVLEFKKRFKAPEDFQKFLDMQGITMNKLRDRYRDMVAIQKMQSYAVRSKIVVSPLEAKRYYEKNKEKFQSPDVFEIRSITIRKNSDKSSAGKTGLSKKEELERLRSLIVRDKLKFEEAAEKNSEDTYADDGGNMGFISKGQFIPHLEEAIFVLEPGEVTPVLESEIGYHIFKLESKKPKSTKTFEEAKKAIEGMLYQEKSKKRFDEWITELREDAYISVR